MTTSSKVGREIGQRAPFRNPAQEAVISLLRTTDMAADRIGGVITPYGITPQQYNVLRILRGAGGEGLPTLTIAERMIERAPGITRLIDRLETKGLVTRNRLSDDRRCVVCRITPGGLDILAQLDEPVNQAEVELLGMLSVKDQKQLIRLLDRIRDGLRSE
jgi:DNA-binding MarR family transcriptional regulator